MLAGSPSHSTTVVGIKSTRSGSTSLCTGSLLLPNLVLTARHCLTPDANALEGGDCKTSTIAPPDGETTVRVIAAPDVDQATEDQIHAVSDAWLPEDDAKLCGQDIVLLLLAEPIDSEPLSLTQVVPAPDSTFTVFGYGIAEGDYGRQRKYDAASLTCIGEKCSDARIARNEFLAQSGACEGDSGGPALDGDGNLFAIASRSDSLCGETAYLTFAEHFEWLAVAVREAAKTGEYAVPKWARPPAPVVVPDPKPTSSPAELHAFGGCHVARVKSRDGFDAPWYWLFLSAGLCAIRLRRKR